MKQDCLSSQFIPPSVFEDNKTVNKCFKMIRKGLKLFFAASAFFITISRVQNYYNHQIDVLYGAVIGTGFASLHIRNAVDVKKQ